MDLSGYTLDTLHEDGVFTLCRARAIENGAAGPASVLVSILTSEHQHPDQIRMLERELALTSQLDPEWAVRPLALSQHQGRAALVLEDRPCESLQRVMKAAPVDEPAGRRPPSDPAMGLGPFLRLSVRLAAALGAMHRRGIIHKNIKPAHALVDTENWKVWLTGFGIASGLPRERQALAPPETIAGTLAYMAPEQTGRMNRSIDSRSDLYGLGIMFYEMLTGSPPFAAADAMEWVHCHIARQPVPPTERTPLVPPPLSAIVMKLLAKTAEDRYQTAAGLERDLRRCLTQFEAEGRIDDFAPGGKDASDRLLIPEKQYGRSLEAATLLDAFQRIVQGGVAELVLVSGPAGIGKSSVVNELYKALVPARTLFAAGKFNQFKSGVPYASLAEALQGLVRSLLAASDRELEQWRRDIREALGPNGQLMVDLVPALKLLVGEQAPVPELSAPDAHRRLLFVFRRFLAVFASPNHPLALFLDDLQWLDASSLALLEDLLSQPDMRHILLIGAYRDNEVTPTHQLMRMLQRIRTAGVRVQDIALAPLACEHVVELTADSLHCDRQRAASLADLIHRKTAGNPFFVIQFLGALVDEGLVRFDHDAAGWNWDVDRIQAKGYTADVIELMVGKLRRLPRRVQELLQQLGCLGTSAELELLATVCEVPPERLRDDLLPALHAELVFHSEGSCRFAHDRVREAAYSMIPESQRPATHLRIGRRLAAYTLPDRRDDTIFQVVNQLNRGASRLATPEEHAELADLNLAAGKRAKASSAYAVALAYLTTGAALLPTRPSQHQQPLMFEFDLHSADCEICMGALREAGTRLESLATRSVGVAQSCAVARRRVELCSMLGASDTAMDVGRDCLRKAGINWPDNPSAEEVRAEYDRLWSKLADRGIEDLVDLPLMQDAASLATLDVLAVLTLPAMLSDENLHALNVMTVVKLSLERGNSHAAPSAYAALALLTGARFGQHDRAYRLATMACHLVERRGLRQFGAKTYHNFAVLVPWTRPLKEAVEPARRAFELAREEGKPASAAHACRCVTSFLLALGCPLHQVEQQAEDALTFTSPFGFFLDRFSAPLALVRTLRGKNKKFGSLDDGRFVESSFEECITGEPSFALLECYYWIRKLQARFFAGDYASAMDAAYRAEKWYATSVVLPLYLLERAEYCFYAALAIAARCAPIESTSYAEHREALQQHRETLASWAETCPENFEDRAALVDAEIARLEERAIDAMNLYERAIQRSRASGFVQIEALAHELAARFYATRGFETIARVYLRNARNSYFRWGADGKVRQLEELHPYLRADAVVAASTDTFSASLQQLDLATVVKVSQAVSRNIDLDTLIESLMRTAMEHAGAQRGLLILSRGEEQRIAAEATSRVDDVLVRRCDEPVDGSVLPEAVLRYVSHTQEALIIEDASRDALFSTDPYVRKCGSRSVLCLPLTNQGRRAGVLYFENHLSPRVFAPARTEVLKLLASQAAISLENSRLYRDVAEREARIRRLVDANIIGIFIWEIDGQIIEANDAFLGIVGYDREEYAARGLRWTELTPPEWRHRDEQMVPALKTSGILQPFEKEYFRKDGSRVPVLVGVASFDPMASQGVAYVVDLRERKLAQEALDRAASELAHVSRISALSALTASIAHEVNQPLSGIVTNAGTCLRMLESIPPNIDGARETARRTIRDGARASDVVARLRGMFSKRDVALESLDLNEAAREVIALSLGELQRNQVEIETQFAPDLPNVLGDRVQLQQVMLNLIRNASEAMAEVQDRPRQVLMRTQREAGDRVRVLVRDTGVGLSPQNLESLFGAFCTTKSGGMGIGLFVSRSIIERHRGVIWGEQNSGAPGATFAFTIPCQAN